MEELKAIVTDWFRLVRKDKTPLTTVQVLQYVCVMASTIANLLVVQITQRTDGKPFDQWNLSELAGARQNFYDYLKTVSSNSIGYSIGQIPLEQYTTEELCLMFILVLQPEALGNLNPTLAEGLITVVRLAILEGNNPTQRATIIANNLKQFQTTQQEIDNGTYNPPVSEKTPLDNTDNPQTQINESFSIWGSITAALESPWFWLVVTLLIIKIFRNKKRNEQ